MRVRIALVVGLSATCQAMAGGPVCTPNNSTSFQDYENQAFTIANDALGSNRLYRQCTNMSDQQLIDVLDDCGPLTHPLNGLGLNPVDNFLYGLMPTDAMGIGTHLELTIPFPAPGEPGDMMKADPVDVYRLGNDGGYQRIGQVDPAPEDVVLPAGNEQVIPTIHTASTFDQTGNMYLLGYKTNYESSADVMAGTGEVLYQAPAIAIGQVTAASLTAASGGVIPATWSNVDTTSNATCGALMTQFAARTNTFSQCVVADFIALGDADMAVSSCLDSTNMLDFGIHDFAVSPTNGNFYALDTMTYDDRDVLVEVNSSVIPMVATCTEFADAGNNTGVMTSLMFSEQNKLVAIFADENIGRWIDVGTGVITALPDSIDPYPFGDGSSLPFALPRSSSAVRGTPELIFYNGFEDDLIFENDFEGMVQPPTCPAF